MHGVVHITRVVRAHRVTHTAAIVVLVRTGSGRRHQPFAAVAHCHGGTKAFTHPTVSHTHRHGVDGWEGGPVVNETTGETRINAHTSPARE